MRLVSVGIPAYNAERGHPVKYLRQENSGVAAAREIGISE